jgi:hypothetical protein
MVQVSRRRFISQWVVVDASVVSSSTDINVMIVYTISLLFDNCISTSCHTLL